MLGEDLDWLTLRTFSNLYDSMSGLVLGKTSGFKQCKWIEQRCKQGEKIWYIAFENIFYFK